MRHVRFSTVAVVSLVAASPAVAQLVGISAASGNLYDVDPATGAASNPRSTGVTKLAGIAYTGGLLYSVPYSPSNPNLIRIDPATGASSVVGSTGLSSIIEGDLAVSPGGTLYGVGGFGLFTFNTSTGTASGGIRIGNIGVADDISGLAFSPSGTLYAVDSRVNANDNARVYTVNPSTGAILNTLVLNVDFGSPLLGSTFEASTGSLLVSAGGTVDLLYRVDLTTGVATTIGSLGALDEPSGLAFVPEPGTAAVIACVAAAGLRRRRR